MAYIPTVWIDGETPVNAENLNKLEDGVQENSSAIEEINTARANGEFQGEPGPAGPQGPKGDPGEQGEKGDAGVHLGAAAPEDAGIALWVAPSSVNALTKAVHEDGTPFVTDNGEVGYTSGYFAEDGEVQDDPYNTKFVSGYIPATPASKVSLRDIALDDMGCYFILYDSDFHMIAIDDVYTSDDLDTERTEFEDLGNLISGIDFASFAGSGFGGAAAAEFAKIAYFRFEIWALGEDPAVFVDTLAGGDSVLKIRTPDGSFKEVGAEAKSETWTFEMEDGTTVTKQVVVK